MSIRKLMRNFILDHLIMSAMYALNSFFLILFFNLYIAEEKMFFYPLAISLFFYVIYMIYRFYGYWNYYRNDLPILSEHHRFDQLINIIHKEHGKEKASLQMKTSEHLRFFSSWIHNMKTPISVTRLALQQHDNMEDEILFSQLIEENTRLLDMLNQAIEMIRIEEIEKDFIPVQVDLVSQLKEAINNKKNSFIQHHVFPIIECESNSLAIITDAKWNIFIIEQILSNAIKYSDKEGSKIICSLKKLDNYVALTIKDCGIGIPPTDLLRIYDAFFTGQNGRLGKSSSGIGLYMVKKISHHLGHKINIASQVGDGTEVTITYLTKT
ncbi:sensor histidine kinase [Vallitalea okinawensis]|uniref:sensor histidine kinase n=1 Tax=Vallitalea okinawensis TaxID=2078660 RepID=UPI000CFD09D4|nr:sensor histidine kinase [Vallitalea okinawensis]